MPDLLLRDVPQHIVETLERQAALHGRSAETEHRLILDAALRAGFWERAAALRAETRGRILGDRQTLFAGIATSDDYPHAATARRAITLTR
jgi:plasmid stability protein